jgi:DNA-binding NarL/FixJ family response regulator
MPSRYKVPPAPVEKLRCVMVEDQVLFEQLFRLMLDSLGFLEIVGVAHTAAEGIAACREHRPDLLLLDLALPDKSGLAVLKEFSKIRPEARTIVVSGEAGTLECPRVLRPFIYSVVDKTRALDVMVREIEGFRNNLRMAGKGSRPAREEALDLTPREAEILQWIGEGLSNKDIAEQACISPQTVMTHRKSIASKLGASGSELVRRAGIHARSRRLASGRI